jgi:hypothetical protein
MRWERSEFLRELFSYAEGNVWLGTLSNIQGGGETASLSTRDAEEIDRFCERWDKPGQGVFFCVATVQAGLPRRKTHLEEMVLLHVDIDLKDVSLERGEIATIVGQLQIPPTILVDSGGGLHAYWLLRESLPATEDNIARVESALQSLAFVVAGDRHTCQAACYMRLPGTHNRKRGNPHLVGCIGGSGVRYELDDIEEWLFEQEPVIAPKPVPISVRARAGGPPANEFEQFAHDEGLHTPLDPDARLDAMTHEGAGDTSIHHTQLSVTAALLNKGWKIEDVVNHVLRKTVQAAGPQGNKWNWRREEIKLRRMCDTWLQKKRKGRFDAGGRDL